MRIYRVLDEHSQITYAAESDGLFRRIEGDVFADYGIVDEGVRPARILAPVAPPNVFAIGLNYRAHARETHKPIPTDPVVFAKATTSLIGPGEPIVLPAAGPDHVDYEVELAVVIGKTCRNVRAADAADYVLGYTVANDVSARDWQQRLGQFRQLLPAGALHPDRPGPRRRAPGRHAQRPTHAAVHHRGHDLLRARAGGAGVGVARSPQVFLRDGDTITCSAEGIGELTNPVVAAGSAKPTSGEPVETWPS